MRILHPHKVLGLDPEDCRGGQVETPAVARRSGKEFDFGMRGGCFEAELAGERAVSQGVLRRGEPPRNSE